MNRSYAPWSKKHNDINCVARDAWRMFQLGYGSPEVIAASLGVKFTDVLNVIRKEVLNRGKN